MQSLRTSEYNASPHSTSCAQGGVEGSFSFPGLCPGLPECWQCWEKSDLLCPGSAGRCQLTEARHSLVSNVTATHNLLHPQLPPVLDSIFPWQRNSSSRLPYLPGFVLSEGGSYWLVKAVWSEAPMILPLASSVGTW